MVFQCVNQSKKGKETWTGSITSIVNYGSHYEIRIDSRSGILVLIGKTSMGNFACMPDFGAGCHLGTLDDKFYSTEKLSNVLGKIDGITVASALYSIADKIHFK
ncbi:hypothetical protein [Clostridium sp.]|uniref:hypothetical protein n=1 Tax=Clostridium sp. TaxID=1506 RepID=UPI003D6D8645